MGTPKSNAVQKESPSEYLVYDSGVQDSMLPDSVLARSLPLFNQKAIQAAINNIKGMLFSGYRARIYVLSEGLQDNRIDSIRVDICIDYSVGLGKVKDTLVLAASNASLERSSDTVG